MLRREVRSLDFEVAHEVRQAIAVDVLALLAAPRQARLIARGTEGKRALLDIHGRRESVPGKQRHRNNAMRFRVYRGELLATRLYVDADVLHRRYRCRQADDGELVIAVGFGRPFPV